MCRIFRKALPALQNTRSALFLVAAASILSLLPDLDCVAGVVAGEFGRFHNNITHSFGIGISVALVAAAVAALAKGTRAGTAWFLFAFACYGLHVVMDYFTEGRGVMALWPFLSDRLTSPVCLFRGVKWAMGIWNVEHLWTFLNELLFVGIVTLGIVLAGRRRQAAEEV